jgi:colanic acid biosynthesis glycosyl transferase WcaI
VWVISELYYPEETSTGYFLTGIAEGLARAFSVSVLCSQPTYSRRGARLARTELHEGVAIERCWSTTLDKDNLLFRAINAVTISVSIALTALRRVRAGDVVLVVTNPPLLPFLTALVCRIRRARLVLIVHDVYPDVLVAAGMMRRGSFSYRVGQRLARWLYRRCDRVVVLGRDMERLVATVGDLGDERASLIPNWGDVDTVRPTDRRTNRVLVSLGLEDKFIVHVMGNMGRTHAVALLLDAARALADEPRVHFLFVGAGAQTMWLASAIAERGLTNVTQLPACPRGELADHLNASDLSAVALLPGMAGVSVPSRLYNILAAGKPVLAIAEPHSELALVVAEERIGWVVSPNDCAGAVCAIREAAASGQALASMGGRARAAAEERYSYELAVARYLELVTQLAATGA